MTAPSTLSMAHTPVSQRGVRTARWVYTSLISPKQSAPAHYCFITLARPPRCGTLPPAHVTPRPRAQGMTRTPQVPVVTSRCGRTPARSCPLFPDVPSGSSTLVPWERTQRQPLWKPRGSLLTRTPHARVCASSDTRGKNSSSRSWLTLPQDSIVIRSFTSFIPYHNYRHQPDPSVPP